jgi:hypothetical protein
LAIKAKLHQNHLKPVKIACLAIAIPIAPEDTDKKMQAVANPKHKSPKMKRTLTLREPVIRPMCFDAIVSAIENKEAQGSEEFGMDLYSLRRIQTLGNKFTISV